MIYRRLAKLESSFQQEGNGKRLAAQLFVGLPGGKIVRGLHGLYFR
jgi:hypothetical protein